MRDASPLVVILATLLICVALVESLVFAVIAHRARVRAEHAQAEAASALAEIRRIRDGDATYPAEHRAER